MDEKAQIIVASRVTQETNDKRQVHSVLAKIEKNTDDKPNKLSADAGYFSEDNVACLEANERINEAYIATGHTKHHKQPSAVPLCRA